MINLAEFLRRGMDRLFGLMSRLGMFRAPKPRLRCTTELGAALQSGANPTQDAQSLAGSLSSTSAYTLVTVQANAVPDAESLAASFHSGDYVLQTVTSHTVTDSETLGASLSYGAFTPVVCSVQQNETASIGASLIGGSYH